MDCPFKFAHVQKCFVNVSKLHHKRRHRLGAWCAKVFKSWLAWSSLKNVTQPQAVYDLKVLKCLIRAAMAIKIATTSRAPAEHWQL
jgi:hypothetical protein